MVVKIAVIGGGINGLACAVKIKEKYKRLKVVLITSEFSPNTTGDGSGGLWYPYLSGDTTEHLLSKWGIESYQFLHQLWLEGGHEVCLTPLYNLYHEKKHWFEPHWSKNVFGYHKLNDKELAYFNKLFSGEFAAGQTFTTFIYSPSPFLSYLFQRFTNAHGESLQAKVDSLQDPILNGFDIVVNCTGLNAKYLVPDDAVFSYRGQVTRVVAPWIFQAVIDEDGGNYILPNEKTCVLGGTHQEHDYNTKVDEKNTAFILNGCKKIMPSLQFPCIERSHEQYRRPSVVGYNILGDPDDPIAAVLAAALGSPDPSPSGVISTFGTGIGYQSAEINSHWVGLRPGRKTVRLEAEMKGSKLIIHNYGHGGCGLTLFWGCASTVLELLDNHLDKKIKDKCKL